MAYLIEFRNRGGVLGRRTVNTEDETQAAVLELVATIGFFADGDSITVTEIED